MLSINFNRLQCINFFSVPGIVTNISHTINKNEHNVDQLDTFVQWYLPCSLNGKIESFSVMVHGTRNGYDPHTFSVQKNYSNIVKKTYMYLIHLPTLKSEYNYSLNISTKVKDVETWGLPASYGNILCPARSMYFILSQIYIYIYIHFLCKLSSMDICLLIIFI